MGEKEHIMKISTLAAVAKLGLLALLAQGASAKAAEVKVLAGAALQGAFTELVPKFEAATGHKLVIEYGATGTIPNSRSATLRSANGYVR